MKLIAVGRTFFAVALVGLGLEHYLFGDFITGRAPAWPKAVPGRLVWAYATGAFFVGTGAALLSGKWARPAAVSAAALIFIWALLRQIPVLATDPLLSGAWTQAGKALTFFGGLLAMAATFPRTTVGPNLLQSVVNGRREYIVAARVCLGTFFVITGIQHFMYTEFVASLIPAWFPGDAVFWTYFAGVALIAGGIGLFIARTAQLAPFSRV